MDTVNLKNFVWQSKKTKQSFIIIAITKYREDNIVIYREAHDRSKLCVRSAEDFLEEFEPTYEL